MIIYRHPLNDTARLAFLSSALTTGVKDIAAGNNYLSTAMIDALEIFVPNFTTNFNDVNKIKAIKFKSVREKNEAFRKLYIYSCDLLDVIKRRARRLNEPAEVLRFYQLPLDGKIPGLRSQQEWMLFAKEIIAGDAKAVAAGYAPAICPSADELNIVLQDAIEKANLVAPADRNFDVAQEQLALLRAEANELIKEVMAELRFNLRKFDIPSQRRIMRSYGASFVSTKNTDKHSVTSKDASDS